jgi:hypothetical protein
MGVGGTKIRLEFPIEDHSSGDALQGYEEALGSELLPSYLPALNTMFSFGDLLSRIGRKDAAEIMYTRALNGYTAVQGPSSKWCQPLKDRRRALEVASVEPNDGQGGSTEIGVIKSLKRKFSAMERRPDAG